MCLSAQLVRLAAQLVGLAEHLSGAAAVRGERPAAKFRLRVSSS